MDGHHIVHLPCLLPGKFDFSIYKKKNAHKYLLMLKCSRNVQCKKKKINSSFYVRFFLHLSDPAVWDHVFRFSRSILLDESHLSLQQR